MKCTPRLFFSRLPFWPLAAAAFLVGVGPRALAGEDAPATPVADRASGAERAPDEAIAALVAFLEKGDEEKPRDGRREAEKRREETREQERREGRRGGERPRGDREESGRRDEDRRGSRPGDAAPAERDRAAHERDRARAERRPDGQPRPSGRRPFDDGPPRVVRPEMARPEARRVAPLMRPQPRGPGMPMIPLTPARPLAAPVAPTPHAVPNAAPPHAVPGGVPHRVGPGAVVVAPPQVRSFAIQVGPDGVARAVPADAAQAPPAPAGGPHAERQQITVQIDGGELKLEGIPGMGGPLNLGGLPGIPGGTGPIQVEAKVLKLDGLHAGEGDAHAHVRQLLDRILDKVNAIESRLGGPGAPGPHAQHGQPMHQPGPQPPHGQPGPHGNPPHPGPQLGGVNPDEINRRFEEHARNLHGRMEEMQRHLAERLQAGGGEQMKQWHQKLAETHEKLQQSFQDIRKRFAEQQERIERLEQEVKKLREELERRGAAAEAAPPKPVSIEIVPVL